MKILPLHIYQLKSLQKMEMKYKTKLPLPSSIQGTENSGINLLKPSRVRFSLNKNIRNSRAFTRNYFNSKSK